MTNKEKQFLNKYNKADCYYVKEFYQRPSWRKIAIEHAIIIEMRNYNGYDYKVVGGNCNFFTCGYKYTDNNNKEHLVYHTYANRYDFIIGE